jgi:hypothetical protein
MYMDDNDGVMLHSTYQAPNFLWSRNLARGGYAPGEWREGSPLFWCPSYRSEIDQTRRVGTHSTFWPYTSYTINMTYRNNPDSAAFSSGDNRWLNTRRIGNASNYWLLSEFVHAKESASMALARMGYQLDNATTAGGRNIHLRHSGETANMLFSRWAC